MRNIELKARISDLRSAEDKASKIEGSVPTDVLHQVDTYFKVNNGRLKLREETGREARNTLVYYERPDDSGPKRCDYRLIDVAAPADLKFALTNALGVLVVVDKKRILYLYKNVRIHLDEVERLGAFIEFEAVMPDGVPDSEGRSLLVFLMNKFEIGSADLIQCSYSDLLLKKTSE